MLAKLVNDDLLLVGIVKPVKIKKAVESEAERGAYKGIDINIPLQRSGSPDPDQVKRRFFCP